MQVIEQKLKEQYLLHTDLAAPKSLVELQFQARLSNVFAGKISYRERVLNGKDGRWPIGCVRDALVYICTGQLPDLDQADYLDHLSMRAEGSHWTDAYIKRLNLFANEKSLEINDKTTAEQINLIEVTTGTILLRSMIDDLKHGERIELGNLVTLSNSCGVIELTYVPPNEYWSGSELTNEGMRELTRIAITDHLAEISLATTPAEAAAAVPTLQPTPAAAAAVPRKSPGDTRNSGLTTRQIADVFSGIHFKNEKIFVGALNRNKWLTKHRIVAGAPGGVEATFDPVGIARALYDKVDARGQFEIKQCFKNPVLARWKDLWEQQLEDLSDE